MKNLNDEYMLVHKSILPDFFPTVIEAREKIEGEKKSVSDVCKELNISRSTYYKYKDYIFYPENIVEHKVSLNISVDDVSGVLAAIISMLTSFNCNVVSINQNKPIGNVALINITVDISSLKGTLNDLLSSLNSLPNVKKVEVIAHE